MKQARITDRKPRRSGRLLWYVLEVVDAPTVTICGLDTVTCTNGKRTGGTP